MLSHINFLFHGTLNCIQWTIWGTSGLCLAPLACINVHNAHDGCHPTYVSTRTIFWPQNVVENDCVNAFSIFYILLLIPLYATIVKKKQKLLIVWNNQQSRGITYSALTMPKEQINSNWYGFIYELFVITNHCMNICAALYT